MSEILTCGIMVFALALLVYILMLLFPEKKTTETTAPRIKIFFADGDPKLELMSDEVHQVWCMWMEYLFTQGQPYLAGLKGEGRFIIDAKSVTRWKRQMITPYAQLSEGEKKSDRDIARRYLGIARIEVAKRGMVE